VSALSVAVLLNQIFALLTSAYQKASQCHATKSSVSGLTEMVIKKQFSYNLQISNCDKIHAYLFGKRWLCFLYGRGAVDLGLKKSCPDFA
jgi:hypothetical protein